MDLVFTEPQTDEEWDTYYRLRYERLRKPHGQPEGSEKGDLEEFTSHVVVKDGDRVVGAGCWLVIPTRHGLKSRYRQMAVDPEYEGHGIGRAITEHVEAKSREAGATVLYGNVRMENVRFFERQGWVYTGPGDKLFGQVDSQAMEKQLT